jgi:uncharacterized protein
MEQNNASDDQDEALDAGSFADWLSDFTAVLRGEHGADVPCGDCTACCTSSQFIHISPDETETLSRVPKALRFPAPRMPRGHVLLGFDERGRCPMLVQGACSIYEHRPRTCRMYDCRVFPAAAVEPAAHQVEIRRRSQRWAFTHPTAADTSLHDAVTRAAHYLGRFRADFPDGVVPTQATQLAVLASAIHAHFAAADCEPAPSVLLGDLLRFTQHRS